MGFLKRTLYGSHSISKHIFVDTFRWIGGCQNPCNSVDDYIIITILVGDLYH